MKELNKKATAIFRRLIEGLDQPGANRKIDNATGGIMAVSVEVVDRTQYGPIVSVAHYYEQNGDLMADPEMTFLVVSAAGTVVPLTYRQDGLGINQEAARIEGKKLLMNKRLQRDLATFANQWMRNILNQQFTDVEQG